MSYRPMIKKQPNYSSNIELQVTKQISCLVEVIRIECDLIRSRFCYYEECNMNMKLT